MRRAMNNYSMILALTFLAPTQIVKGNSGAKITCPRLSCDSEAAGFPPVPDGYCFMHDQQSPVLRMSGALCYDISIAKMSEPPMYCPFDIANEESFMWMDEVLQQQQGTDKNMLCK